MYSINVTCDRTTPCRRDVIAKLALKLSSDFNGTVHFITYSCHQTTPLGHIPIKPMVVIPSHEACELDLLNIYNSTNDCTILIFLLRIVTYDLLLHVSALIRRLQGAICAWLKLHILLILIK